MKLSNLLSFLFLFISSNLFSQAHSFRCLENEVYSIGCTTCDNVRTGKMITGIEVNLDGRKTELYNPIIAKYTTTTVTLIDYKFTTVTIKLASTYFASITDLLNAVKVCSDIGYSAGIDTLTYTNDTLKISFTNDSIAAYKVKIGDEQYIDTATYSSDTLKLSLYNDKKAQTKIYIPSGGGGTDDQKIDTFSIVSNSLRLSLESDGEIYKSVNLGPYLDNTDAQKIDTFSLSNDSIKLSLEGDLEKYKSFSLNEYRQKIDTFSYSSDTLRIGLSNDSSLYKKVYIPQITDTDDQTVDTFDISSNVLRLSLQGDNQAFKSVSLSGYLDNTDAQTLSWVSGSGNLTISGGNTVNLDGRYLLTEVDGSVTNEAFTIDADDADTEVISNQTLKFEGAGIVTTDYVPASDKLIITATEVDGSTSNELQNLSYGSKSGSDVPVNISSGAGINLTQGTNIFLDRIASNYLTIEGRTTIDTFSFASDTLKISLTNDLEAAKKIYIPSASTTNNIVTNGNIITSTVNGVSDTILAVRTVSNTSSTNNLSTTVNGVTGSNVNIINSNSNSISGNVFTGSVNGVSDTSLIIGTNLITFSNGILTSNVNGVTDTSLINTVATTNVLSLSGNTMTSNVNGVSDTSLVIGTHTVNLSGNQITSNTNGKTDTTLVIGTVSNTSTTNSLSTTVNGKAGSAVNIINSNVSNLSGNTITNTINGVADTVLVIGQHTLTSSGNSMTNIENGLSASANIVNSISNTSSTNSLSTTVNGVTGSNVNIINSNVTGFSNSILTTTINGVSDTALINISGGTSKGWNGLRYSNDTIFRGSNSSTLDNGSKLRFNTYNYMDTYFDSYINATGGATLPTLHLKANNDVWFGAQDTTTAGTAYASNNPVFYFRYANNGALNFGLNTTSNINRLGSGSINFGYTGSAKGDYAFNSGLSGIASSTYAINLGANGQAITGTAAFNSAAYGISSGFSSISMGYNSTVSNDYAFNSGRNSAASGYESVNMGAVGTASNTGSKNFGYNGQVSGYQSLGFQENNYTLGNYEMNGSYYTYSRAYGQSRFGYLGIDFTSQDASAWVASDILFTIDNGKNDTTRSCALTMNARGWTQHRDIGTTQIKVLDSLAKPKAVLEIVSTTSGMIPAGGTKSQRDAIWNEGTQTGNFTPTYTKGWVNSAGNSVMDQCGLQFMTTNETLGSSLYVIRWNGTSYIWHQIY